MENNSCIRLEANTEQISSCKDTISELEGSFEVLSTAFNLAGNNVRLKILYLLSKEEKLCVCDLSDILEMNISAISQHLRKLKDKDLVSKERKGQTIFYALTPEYQNLFAPFFSLLENDNILEAV